MSEIGEKIKRIECKKHPKHAITNFCKNPQCFLPLCPECVVIHTSYHRERNLHGEFDTIENTLSFCDSKLEDFETRYQRLEADLLDCFGEIKRSEDHLSEKIDNIKASLITMIEKTFESLKRDIGMMYKGLVDGMTRDYELMARELKEKKREMGDMRRNLDIYPTKTVIELYSTMFVIEHHNFQTQLSAFSSHLMDQAPELEINNCVIKDVEHMIADNLLVFSKKGININRSLERTFMSPEPKIPRLRMNPENRDWGFIPDRGMRSPIVFRDRFLDRGSPLR